MTASILPIRPALTLLTALPLLAVLLAPVAVPAQAAEKPPAEAAPAPVSVPVRVWPHAGYGRMVFDWKRETGHEVALERGTLTIRFARPLSADLGAVTERLANYATAAAIAADGRTVTVSVKPGVRYKTFTSETSVVVDLLPATDAKAEVKKDTSPSRDDSVRVPVRVGNHATFNRFVFDWPRAVDFDVARDGGKAVIRFDRRGNFDLQAARRDLPPFVRAIDAGDDAVTLALADGVRLRHFRSGTGVVLDVLRPSGAEVIQKAATASDKPVPAASPSETQVAAAKDAQISGAPEVQADEPPQPLVPTDMPDVSQQPASAADADGSRAESETVPARASAPASGPRLQPVPVEEVERALSDSQAKQGIDAAPMRLIPVAASGTVPVILSIDDKTAAVMRFHWPDEVGAAVFTRGGWLWAVFDRESRFAFEGWKEAMAEPSPNSRRIPEDIPAKSFVDRPFGTALPGYSVFRMRVPDGVNPRVARDGDTWAVTLERDYLRAATGINVESHLGAATGARLFVEAPNAAQAVAVPDPEVGDRIWIVPLAAPGKGIGLGRTYTEVELFATAQGVAGRTIGDNVAFHTLQKGIEIASRSGLTLSGTSVVLRRAGGADGSPKSAGPARDGWLFDVVAWQRRKTGNFIENKHRLLRAAAMASPTDRNRARLELAQLLFAYRHYADTLGLLEVIEQDAPELTLEPVFLALRGGAYYWLGRYDRAARDFGDATLDGFQEIALWRAALAAQRKGWGTAARLFVRADRMLGSYPVDYRVHFGLLAAEAALAVGDIGLARFHIENLMSLNPDRTETAAIDYMRGKLLVRALDNEGAIAAWQRAARGPDRRIRVKALLASANLRFEKDRIDARGAVQELEKLRYAWRGDDLEFNVIRRLGEFHIAAGDYRNGLMTLRDLATHFPGHPDADAVIDIMRKAFVKLYVDGAADGIPPLRALALYDQFRELTPEGEVGDDLIARLADRLVSVDLLDRSATLLRHLVDRRLTGTDRLDAANRLALVYLLDRKPDEALAMLAGQVPAGLVPEIAATRGHLRARAMTELARYDEALQLIESDDSIEAETLRADIHWKLRNWAAAARSYARVVDAATDGAAGKNRDALGPAAQNNVMSLAIAYALSGNQAALGTLRQRFLAAMENSPFEESFDVVTAPSGNVEDNYRAIAGKVAEVDRFSAFMESYRAKLLTRGKSPEPRPGNAEPAEPQAAQTPPQAAPHSIQG